MKVSVSPKWLGHPVYCDIISPQVTTRDCGPQLLRCGERARAKLSSGLINDVTPNLVQMTFACQHERWNQNLFVGTSHSFHQSLS